MGSRVKGIEELEIQSDGERGIITWKERKKQAADMISPSSISLNTSNSTPGTKDQKSIMELSWRGNGGQILTG